jgi:hypothetical protein
MGGACASDLHDRLKNNLLLTAEIGFASRNNISRATTQRENGKGADHERAWRVEQIA